MMVADEIRALLLIHDRLKAWERPFIRDMAKLREQRGFLMTKQLATIRGIMDRHRISSVPAQAVPGQLRIRGEITTSILLLVPSHGLISLLPWEPTASVTDLETAAVNSPRILRERG